MKIISLITNRRLRIPTKILTSFKSSWHSTSVFIVPLSISHYTHINYKSYPLSFHMIFPQPDHPTSLLISSLLMALPHMRLQPKVGLHHLQPQLVECHQVMGNRLWKPIHFFFHLYYFSECLDHLSSACSMYFLSFYELFYICCPANLSSLYIIWQR